MTMGRVWFTVWFFVASGHFAFAAARSESELRELVRKELRSAGDACFAVQSETDLHSVVANLQRLQAGLAKQESVESREASAHLAEGIVFVFRWQDYLAARRNGFGARAVALCKSLSRFPVAPFMARRSRILERARESPSEPGEIGPPAAPSGVDKRGNEDGCTDMTWTNNDDDATSVCIRIRARNGSWKLIAELPPTATIFHLPSKENLPPCRSEQPDPEGRLPRVRKAIESALAACADAKETSDLDATMEALAAIYFPVTNADPAAALRARAMLDVALLGAAVWQEHLAEKKTGNYGKAAKIVADWRASNVAYPFVLPAVTPPALP